MAGSLDHITDEDGSFTMDCIDNIGDAHEALEECFNRMKRAHALLGEALMCRHTKYGVTTSQRIREAMKELEA